MVSVPAVADASCGHNGYGHSGGKCGGWDRDDDDDDEDRFEREDDNEGRHGNGNRGKGKHGNRFDNSNISNSAFLDAYIERLLLLISQYQKANNSSSNLSDIDVRTLGATDIDEDSATLRAIVDMNGEDTGELYFEYGRTSGSLSLKTSRQNLDDADDGDTQEVSVNGLEDNTRYYFRAVAVDENGDKDYGVINNFLTDDTNNNTDEDPTVTTQSAQSIDSDSAELRGVLDMNDFENGIAFYVYGEDEDQVRDVDTDFDTYADVDEDNENLQKILVDSDVDGNEIMNIDVTGLDNNTDIFFSLCAEYEDEDGDDTLVCGSVREFTTD